MDERFITDDGIEVALVNPRHTEQFAKLSGQHETFDYECFDFRNLKPMEHFSLRWNRSIRFLIQASATFRFFLAVAALVVIVSQVSSVFPYDDVDELGRGVFMGLSQAIRYMPVPFLLVYMLQFNNAYAEMVYYKYLVRGALIDFPSSGSVRIILRQWIPLLFVLYFTAYLVFSIIVLLMFKVSFAQFLVYISAMSNVLVYWYQNQGLESRLLSLSEFIQSFPDSTGEYNNMDKHALGLASAALANMTLLEGNHTPYDSFWRRSYFKDVYSTAAKRTLIATGFRAAIAAAVVMVVLYAFFSLSSTAKASWQDLVNPCVTACVYEDTLNYQNSSRCSGCLCRCLRNLGKQLCDCATLFAVSNCSRTTPGAWTESAPFCSCAAKEVAC